MIVMPPFAISFLVEQEKQQTSKKKTKPSTESFHELLDIEMERLEREESNGKS